MSSFWHGCPQWKTFVLASLSFLCFLYVAQRGLVFSGEQHVPHGPWSPPRVYMGKEESVKNIFFIETSGHGALTSRMACSVESAAKFHPDWRVNLLYVTNGGRLGARNALFSLLENISNVVIENINASEVLKDTPLEAWYRSGKLQTSQHHVVDLSDALRLAVVYKYGGAYMDLDIVVLRSIENLSNCVSQTPTKGGYDMTANGFLIFDKGHDFLKECMDLVPGTYTPSTWGTIGPRLLRRVVLRRCNARSVAEVVLAGNCSAVRVLPHNLFLPVIYNDWKLFFDTERAAEVWDMSRDSYVMHVYNALSASTAAVEGCAYEEAAQMHCPLSWKHSVTQLGYF